MCGIAGLVGPNAELGQLAPMLAAIEHRGPDDVGHHCGRGAVLGMRRLSIIDLAGGHQPMLSADGRYAIVFNGEIYNYLELAAALRTRGQRLATESDTEVILRLFELDGPACLAELRGMFAFAIWDDRAGRLFLARDRLGKKPLYYGRAGATFAFASELKSVRGLAGVDLTLDPEAVEEYFTYRYVPGPRTILRAFRKLPPGHSLTLEAGTTRLERYWRPDGRGRAPTDPAEAEAAFAEALEASVALRLRSDVPVGAFLSGGLDSSVVVALMARQAGRAVRTFSVGFPGRGAIDELAAARRVADHFGTDHCEVEVEPKLIDLLPEVVWHLDEPLADPAAVPTYVMSRIARQSVKVVLTGEGGDELFGGYPYLRTLRRLARLPARPAPVRAAARYAAAHLPRRGPARPLGRAAELLGGDLSDALRVTLSVFREPERRRLLTIKPNGVRSTRPPSRDVNGLLRELALTWLPDELLMKVDKMSMAASLEARAPYLDHRLFELVGSLPDSLKVDRGSSKILLRRAARRWLPPDVVARPKQGFLVPLDEWLRGELRPLVDELLGPAGLARPGLINPAAAAELVAGQRAGRSSGLQIWTMLCFQLWYQRFYAAA